jgi:hypothetical protein
MSISLLFSNLCIFAEDTQDPAHEEAITAQVTEWICSRDISNVHASDVLSNFPDISMVILALISLFNDY